MIKMGSENDDDLPPSSIECEQGLIGTVLANNSVYHRVMDTVKPEHFHEVAHQKIWEIVQALINKGTVATAATVKLHIGGEEVAEGITVGQYVSRLTTEATSPNNAVEYAKVVYELWVRRELVALANDLRDMAMNPPVEATGESIFSMVDAKMEVVRPAIRKSAGFQPFDIIAHKAAMAVQTAYQGTRVTGFPTGFFRIDEITGGLHPSDLVILAGRPGMGKSALAVNIAFNVAELLQERRKAGEKTGVVAISSLEMSGEQIGARALSDKAQVAGYRIRNGHAQEDDIERIILTSRESGSLPIYIDETGALSISSLCARVRELNKRVGVAILVVDYLQLLSGSGTRRDAKRVDDVTEITGGLKALAKELNIPVLALSQLSRRVDERPDKRPMLSDLRESGSIEQDADVVMFTFRQEYYLKSEEPQEGSERYVNWQADMDRARGVANVIIGKNRHGRTGIVTMGFEADYTRFTNDPPPREPTATFQEERKKKRFPKEASILYGLIRSMSQRVGKQPTDEQKKADRSLNPKALLVEAQAVRVEYAKNLFGTEEVNAEIKKSFHTAFKALRDNETAFYTGQGEDYFVWLPELAG